MLTMTAAEIRDLARFAGFMVDDSTTPESDLETEITVMPCPPEGVRNDGEPSDSDSVSHYRFIALCAEYPEEGCIGLGNEIAA